MDANALGLYALAQVEGLDVRAAGKQLGISHTLVSEWRQARADGDPIPVGQVARRKVLRALEELPVPSSPDYAAGIRVGLGKVEELAEELRHLLKAAEPASEATQRVARAGRAAAARSRRR